MLLFLEKRFIQNNFFVHIHNDSFSQSDIFLPFFFFERGGGLGVQYKWLQLELTF